MIEVQVGSTGTPIKITPRIGNLPVTQTQIKNNYSNAYISDGATPIAFALEYRTRSTTAATIAWDAGRSTESEIFFDVPDSFWQNAITYTVLFYWTIGGEKNYTEEAIQIKVKDLHRGP